MSILLTGHHRDSFVAALRAYRETFSISDAEFAEEVLKVSLNTYKKCVRSSESAPLTLDYDFLSGRFFLYRRSLLTARHITRSILEIGPSETKECLQFHELHHYVSESGVRDEQHYRGDIFLNAERTVLSMPAYFGGQVRLTLLLMPEHASGKDKPLKTRGAALLFGISRGYWQPAVTCVFVEGPLADRRSKMKDLCKTIYARSDEYGPISAELKHAEEHATIMTPLMWSKLPES
jgi:hypothetical protein